MVADAQSHSDEDRRRREEVDARNQADAIAYQVERQIGELGDRAPANERARAEAMIDEVREMVKNQSSDVAKFRQLSSDLQQLASGLQSAAYTRAAAGGAQGPGAGPGSDPGTQGQQGTQDRGSDDVIDAEFKPRS
jgi:molecular chaperone DnaK